MLLTSPNELKAIYPSSRFQSIEPLKPMFENVERGLLQRVLGFKLLRQIINDYKELCFRHDGIWSDRIEEPTEQIYIIRACQSVEVFFALRDNVGILSSSLNQGGGFNEASAQNYDTLSDGVRKDLKGDLYHNANRSLEMLLVILEEDAKTDRIYTDLWKESSYYYYQRQLLIPSASIMHPFFYDLGVEPHSKFISLLTNISDAQNLRIGARIGVKLLRELISLVKDAEEEEEGREGRSAKCEGIEGTEGTEKDEGRRTKDEGAPRTSYFAHRTSHIEPDTSERRLVLLSSLDDIRRAISSYVRSDVESDQLLKNTYIQRGERYLNLAIDHYLQRPDLFHDELATDLATDYKNKHHGRGIDDDPNCKHHHHRDRGNLLDLGGLSRK